MIPVPDARALELAIAESGLGSGEMSAIILGRELNADLVLMDESKARRYAIAEGLAVQGCIGILENLYQRNYLLDLRGAHIRLLAVELHQSGRAASINDGPIWLRPN